MPQSCDVVPPWRDRAVWISVGLAALCTWAHVASAYARPAQHLYLFIALWMLTIPLVVWGQQKLLGARRYYTVSVAVLGLALFTWSALTRSARSPDERPVDLSAPPPRSH